MAQTTCPDCGVTVQVGVDIADSKTMVALEVHTDGPSEAARYRVISPGPPLQVERVPDGWDDQFYPDHRYDCPGHGAGLLEGTLT